VRGKLAWRRLYPLYQGHTRTPATHVGPSAAASVASVRRHADAAPGETTVTAVVPTLDHPGQLTRALGSLSAQRLPADTRLDIVVVDNSAAGTASRAVEALARCSPHRVRVVALPKPGVASARNRGVAEAGGQWIAFLDDDQEAGPDWVAQLLATAWSTGADAVFGPVEARSPDAIEESHLANYFSRQMDVADGADVTRRAAFLGTGNSMFHRRCFAAAPPFAPALDGVGGEDSLLLQRLVRDGRVFAWSAEARVLEWVPHARWNWRYVYRRKFLSGQIRTMVQRMLEPPRWGAVVFWMGVGAVQAAAGGVLWAGAYPFAPTSARRWHGVARGGLGKVLWMRPFRPGLYGTGRVS
jgi:glycosyltransferase involved in cell wall biosynthesis